ncbi:unnamed protein product [Rotaria sordida]|uniref:PX domain-containing protein n=1 Tax=Rotaria sordida TaxID=392033 RepID=A0A815LMQ6_9BILA|nr:unnamed protein product [Rotaria sordida]CAF3866140.1 unnamed protein product [Rotaria sordida]
MALWITSSQLGIRRDIQITNFHTNQKFTEYTIEIHLDDVHWYVKKRYSEFAEFHEELIKQIPTIDVKSLPPKKLLNKNSPDFIHRRRLALDNYLKYLYQFFTMNSMQLPECFVKFLDFHLYEVHGIVRKLAEELFLNGDKILSASTKKVFSISPLQMYAITRRMKLAEPPCDSNDPVKDLSHVLDFLCHVKYVQIVGSPDNFGTSTIKTQFLPFDVSFFKSVEELELDCVQTNQITGIDNLKKTVRRLSIHRSLTSIREIALSSLTEIPPSSNEWLISTWKLVTYLDLSKNSLHLLDESLKLFCKTETLDLSYNLLETTIDHLQHLHFLQNLNLSNNRLHDVSDFNARVGNIRSLDLSFNELITTDGLSRLYSLITLNLSSNKLDSIKNIESLGSLPCLENLCLKNNPLTRIVDYRIRVFAVFYNRAKDVWLDGQMPDQRELDRAAVISAMSRAKQNEAAQATMLVQKVLSPTTPVLLSSSLLRQKSNTNLKNMNAASSCPSNLTIIEKQPDVVLDTKANNNNNNDAISTEETNIS